MSAPSQSGPATMSAACRREITEPSEGKRLAAYRDCVGVWTVGYGHTSRAGAPAVTPGLKISEAQADEILSRDLGVFERGVASALTKARAPVAQCEFDALVDLAFNIGLGAFRSSSLLRAYCAGDKATAARKFMDWNRAGGRVVAGLTQRRARERAWFLTGRLPSAPARPIADETGLARALEHPDAPAARVKNLVVMEGVDIMKGYMKGYRTLIVGFALATGPAALQYLGAIDWTTLLGPTGAFFVSGVVAIAMRFVTTSPVGKPARAGQ